MTAAEKILRKALVGSSINSEQWSHVQAGLRDRAFFSATVENVRLLHDLRREVARHAAGGASLSETRRDMRDAVLRSGYARPDVAEGTVRDLLSQRRLDLIVKTNVQQARGWKQYLEGTSPGALAAYPSQRLVRVRERRMPRNWDVRWREAGEAVGWQGACRDRLVALKTSPIWARLSRFGNPFPPFDFNSGMGLEDVGRRQTVELGLATREELGEMVKRASETPPPDFNGSLQAEVPFAGNTPEYKALVDRFGDQVTHEGGRVVWRGGIIREAFTKGEQFEIHLGKPTAALKKLLDADDAKRLKDKSFTVTGDWLDKSRKDGTTHRQHFEPLENDPRNIPMTSGDLELIPTLWRSPDRVSKGGYNGAIVCELDTIDNGILKMVVDISKTPKIHTLYKKKSGLG